MSEFLAEARVLIRPDTTKFRAELEAELRLAAGKPFVIPVIAAPGAAGATASFGAAQKSATGAVLGLASATEAENTALRQGAALLNVSSVNTAKEAAAAEAAGVAKQKAAISAKQLASTQTLAAGAAAKLALAQEAVHGSASAVGAAQVTLTRSTAAVAAAERELGAAINTRNIAVIDAASQSVRLAEAQALEAESALAAARAQATHAQTLAAVNKAAVASTAGALGLRGAVLTAGTAFIAAVVGFQAIKKSIQGASDLNEEINKTVEVFHQSSDEILKWSETTAEGIGIARVEALRAVGTFGELFRTLNVGPEKAAQLSQSLVELSADFASFFNADPARVLAALQSGLVGQARPLRQFGVFLTEARVQQEALNESGKKSASQLTQQEKILARYTLILRDGAIASGDFARTQGQLANQTRILKADIADLSDEIGQMAVGPVTQVVGALRSQIAAYRDLITLGKLVGGGIVDLNRKTADTAAGSEKTADKILGFEKSLGKLYFRALQLGPTLTLASLAVDKLGLGAERAAPKINVLSQILGGAIGAVEDLGAALRNAEKKREAEAGGGTGSILGRIAGFDERKVGAQIRGDTTALLDVLREEQAFLEAQLERIFVQKRPKLRRQIKNALLGTVNEIASAQQSGADATKRAAQDAAQAQQDADQALLELLSTRREDVSRAGDRAKEEGRLGDAIRSENRLQALIKQQILKIRAQIDDQKARKSAIRDLRIALIASRAEEDALRQQRAQDAAARKRESIDLDIDFASITGNTAREIAARQRLIALLKKQQAGVKKGTAEWKRLRNDIAEQQQAIKDAKKQADEGKQDQRTFQQASFEFLQQQQGFAANLLGNLIPSGATGGLVGGGGGPSPAFPLPVAAQVSQESQIAAGKDKGFSAGQGNTTNELLRKMLKQLERLNGNEAAPEARTQRVMQSGSGEYQGHGY